RVAELTGGDSLKSNIQLVFNNAVLACEIAKEYQQIV
ncbi:pseudouridine-5'-phosphate glycosidase, partial [Escherichia coli]|nr:pseudouridine-5'-phosphate glycosidase [Escherichia coli]